VDEVKLLVRLRIDRAPQSLGLVTTRIEDRSMSALAMMRQPRIHRP
jgi:hypothetical protein